ncbi:hypothetical protein QUW55_05780 [Phocaeicola barnesiae]|uniref:hypothetical protein n=1 Tax=Phocaeicola barnesiae TaxID=376804 RepID=UPI0025A39AD3|nr:hypothetical protein [Phocaeicola barnesiae]MDM8251124.1 hypothetical protein [Phocaeicola barnesiae]
MKVVTIYKTDMNKTNIFLDNGWSFSSALYKAVRREQPPSHHSLQDDGHPEEVTVADAFKNSKIVFTPKQKMRDAANQVKLSINRPKKETTSGGTTTDPGSGNEGSFG